MFGLKPRQIICGHCLARRFYSTSSSSFPPSKPSETLSLPSPPPPSGFTNLQSRRLISLHGQDASHFLQGLTTANIPSSPSSQTAGFYSAFLNAQGRVLHDVFIYPAASSPSYRSTVLSALDQSSSVDEPAFLIEVDADEVDTLFRWLKRYKLRAKISLRKLEEGEWSIYSAWNDWAPSTSSISSTPQSLSPGLLSPEPKNLSITAPDTRAPTFGHRILLPHPHTPISSLPSLFSPADETTQDQYRIRRILHGIPEGQGEIIRESALPLESCMDYMLGIDFRKGCYVGQELTIRTHHTGVVRKRILPVVLYEGEGHLPEKLCYDPDRAKDLLLPPLSQSPTGTQHNISRLGAKGRSAGKWLGGVGNVGLALCRLELMVGGQGQGEFAMKWEAEAGREDRESVKEGGEIGRGGEVRVKAFVPEWHREREAMVGLKKRVH